jgi:BMFP domain-containing protein YqiC
MPITVSLSRKFREKLGDEVTNELVAWLNAVDQSYRQEFRDLFEAHFGRLEERMNALEARMNTLEARMTAMEARIEARFADMEARLEAKLDAKLEAMKSELLRWMFLFWVGSMGTILAILKL